MASGWALRWFYQDSGVVWLGAHTTLAHWHTGTGGVDSGEISTLWWVHQGTWVKFPPWSLPCGLDLVNFPPPLGALAKPGVKSWPWQNFHPGVKILNLAKFPPG